MVGDRACSRVLETGRRCAASPQRDRDLCFWHDPEHEEAANEARKLGGKRRRREGMVAGAYEFEGLRDVPSIRRLLEVAVLDTLQLDNSVARNRTLATLAQSASRLLEVGELEARVDALEEALGWREEAGKRR